VGASVDEALADVATSCAMPRPLAALHAESRSANPTGTSAPRRVAALGRWCRGCCLIDDSLDEQERPGTGRVHEISEVTSTAEENDACPS
jgi:hypothetical protein